MAAQPLSLTALARFVGDGWCLFVRGATGGEVLLLPGGSLGIGGGGLPAMNAIHVWAPGRVAATLRRCVPLLRERGLAGVVYAPETVAAEVVALAGELGLSAAESGPLMLARAAEAKHAEDGYAVERVTGVVGFDEAAETLDDAFEAEPGQSAAMLGAWFTESPGVDLFVARHHGQPVAVAGTARLGPQVGVYAVGTRQSHRRRGAAAAAVSAAVDYHVRGGAHLFGLRSTVMAEPLFAGLGFVVACRVHAWRVSDR